MDFVCHYKSKKYIFQYFYRIIQKDKRSLCILIPGVEYRHNKGVALPVTLMLKVYFCDNKRIGMVAFLPMRGRRDALIVEIFGVYNGLMLVVNNFV